MQCVELVFNFVLYALERLTDVGLGRFLDH